MERITLYSGPLSMFGAKAQVAALEKGLDVDLVMVPFDMQRLYEPKHPEVVRINPKRQVPVLVQGDVELFDSFLRVPLPSGRADFHYRWLRHNCDVDRHPTTRERTVCSSELPEDVHATRAHVEASYEVQVRLYTLACARMFGLDSRERYEALAEPKNQGKVCTRSAPG